VEEHEAVMQEERRFVRARAARALRASNLSRVLLGVSKGVSHDEQDMA
jgi:hypothetical protein